MPTISSAARTDYHGGLRGRETGARPLTLQLDVISLGALEALKDTFVRSSGLTTMKIWHLKEMSSNFIGCNDEERMSIHSNLFKKYSCL